MSRSFRIGLMILGVLSLVDVAGPLMTDGDNPPMSVALAGALLGAASLVCAYLAWRGSHRAVLPLVALRLLSAISTTPAFFAGDFPAAIRGLAAVIVLLSIVGVALVIGSRGRQPVQA